MAFFLHTSPQTLVFLVIVAAWFFAPAPVPKDPSLKFTLTSIPGYGFTTSVGVGSKSMDQRLFMDTVSRLLWLYCLPCSQRVRFPGPLFDPSISTTFNLEDCNSDICIGTGAVDLKYNKKKGRHDYQVRYGDDRYSYGYLARDIFMDGKNSEEVVFGCSYDASLSNANGVLGLANATLSIVSQMGVSKFSYCLGNLSDRSYPHSFLVIGNDAFVPKPAYTKIPLMIDGHYYINLERIHVGAKLLNVNPLIFKRNPESYTGGMVIDTGSINTILPLVAVKKFERETIALIGSSLRRTYSQKTVNHTKLCYMGVLTRDLQRFPKVKFTFQGGAVMELTPEHIFHQLEDEIFCLTIIPIEKVLPKGTTISILGNVIQQFFHIVIDLSAKEVSFKNVDCGLVK